MAGEEQDTQQQPTSRTSQRTREAAAEAARKRREGRQPPRDESRPDDAREEQPADTSQEEAPEESSTPRPSFLRRLLTAIPMIIAGAMLIGYFVWLCLEMSSAAPFGGSALPAGIFGGVLVGGIAGAAGMKSAR